MLRPFLAALRRAEPDWRFIVYVSDAELAASLDGVTPITLPTNGWRRTWLELVALDRRSERDGAVLMLNLLNSGALVPRLPTITWQRNSLYFDRRWLIRQPLRLRVEAGIRRNVALLTCRSSIATLTPSAAMGDFVHDWRLGKRLRVEVVPHGVDVARFTGVERRLVHQFTIGVMGHAALHRGLADAVRVLAEVRSDGVDARLLLTVPRQVNPAFQHTIDHVATTAAALGVTDHVVFGGPVSDPPTWYQQLDVLLIPSHCESFCFPVVEGFAAGTPVVTSGLPVLRELAGDLALHGETPAAMAAQVLQICRGPEVERRRRCDLARRRAEELSWNATASKVQKVIKEALARDAVVS